MIIPNYGDMMDEDRMRCVSVIHTVAANVSNRNLNDKDFREFVLNSISTIPSAIATHESYVEKNMQTLPACLTLDEFRDMESKFVERYKETLRELKIWRASTSLEVNLAACSDTIDAYHERIVKLADLIGSAINHIRMEKEDSEKFSKNVLSLAEKFL